MTSEIFRQDVAVKLSDVTLTGEICIPASAEGVVLFSHGSGSSRFSPRNQFVAQKLQQVNLGTFLFDLLTREEDSVYSNRFNIELITNRLVAITNWFIHNVSASYALGYFGASTGAASALWAASILQKEIKAVVSRGGRPDLAIPVLSEVTAPTLFIVGSLDHYVIQLNEMAFNYLRGEKKMVIIQDATHLFEEEGKLEEVAEQAALWFTKHLKVRELEIKAL